MSVVYLPLSSLRMLNIPRKKSARRLNITAILGLICTVSFPAVGQDNCSWMAALPYYDIRYDTASADNRQASADYLCSVTEESRRNQRGSSGGGSVDVSYGGVGVGFGSNSSRLSQDEFEKLDSYCQNRSESSDVSSDVVTVLNTINSHMAAALQSCIGRPGMWGWMTLSDSARYVTLHLRYRPVTDSKAQLQLLEASPNLSCSREGVALAKQPFANIKRSIRCERLDDSEAQIVINTSADLANTDGAFYIPAVHRQEELSEPPRRQDFIFSEIQASQWLQSFRSDGGQLLTSQEFEEAVQSIRLNEVAPYQLELPLCGTCSFGLTFRCSEQVKQQDDLANKKVRVAARRSLVELTNSLTAVAVPLVYTEVPAAMETDLIQCIAYPTILAVQ